MKPSIAQVTHLKYPNILRSAYTNVSGDEEKGYISVTFHEIQKNKWGSYTTCWTIDKSNSWDEDSNWIHPSLSNFLKLRQRPRVLHHSASQWRRNSKVKSPMQTLRRTNTQENEHQIKQRYQAISASQQLQPWWEFASILAVHVVSHLCCSEAYIVTKNFP